MLTDQSVEFRELSIAEGYGVSSNGRVFTRWRPVDGRGFHGKPKTLADDWLEVPQVFSEKYPRVKVNCKYYRVHVLVLTAFQGPCPDGFEGCHDDDNPMHNDVENLYWGTRSENLEDAHRNDRRLR